MNKQVFKDKILIISGGLGDIGKAICIAFAKQGADIAIADKLPGASSEGFLEQLRHDHLVRCRYDRTDVSDMAAIKKWLAAVEGDMGVPSLIIANAATVTQGNILELTPEQWAGELNANLNGAFYMAQHACQRLVALGQPGRVVFMGSWAAHAVHLNMAAYSVSKAAIRMLSKCMALELAPHHILVNEVAPGYVKAGLSQKIWDEQPELAALSAARVPTGKLISADAVAQEVIHLCRPDNEHITGTTVLMDGGLSLRN